MNYIRIFLVSAPLWGLFYHAMTEQPLPWWPDTVIMGGFMGALTAFVWMRLTHARLAVSPFRRAATASRRFVRGPRSRQ